MRELVAFGSDFGPTTPYSYSIGKVPEIANRFDLNFN